jgi:thiamine biosynthesis lipoprotein
MGTAIGLDLRSPKVSSTAIEAAFDHLRDIDARFSTYRPDSEISRLGWGQLSAADCSPDVSEVLARCEEVRTLSRGYFDIRAHRADGRLDPSGFVKGWAVENAARILDAAGARNYCLNAGGDVITRGEPEPGAPWRIGIRHPELPDRLATVVEARDLAVATSGGYERGDHIADRLTSSSASRSSARVSPRRMPTRPPPLRWAGPASPGSPRFPVTRPASSPRSDASSGQRGSLASRRRPDRNFLPATCPMTLGPLVPCRGQTRECALMTRPME